MINRNSSFEEKLLYQLAGIERSIERVAGIGHTIESLYQDWKSPVNTMAEQMAPQFKEYEEKERAERQLKTIERQNWILIVTVVVNAIVSVTAALIQSGIIKIN